MAAPENSELDYNPCAISVNLTWTKTVSECIMLPKDPVVRLARGGKNAHGGTLFKYIFQYVFVGGGQDRSCDAKIL